MPPYKKRINCASKKTGSRKSVQAIGAKSGFGGIENRRIHNLHGISSLLLIVRLKTPDKKQMPGRQINRPEISVGSVIMRVLKPMLPYLAIIVAGFYVLPLIMMNTGMAMLILLVALPILCIIYSYLYSLKNGFSILFPIIVALSFIPAVFIFYNESAFIYVFIYFAVTLAANLVGMIFYKRGQ